MSYSHILIAGFYYCWMLGLLSETLFQEVTMSTRVFPSREFELPQDGEPFRSIVKSTEDSAIIVWHVKPGQTIQPHIHPYGQDTWTVLSGSGQYIFENSQERKRICAGDIVVAERNEIHGVENDGDVPFVFVSVVSPMAAGYELKN